MKTSNKIIIAFSVFIVGGMFTLFSTAKLHKSETPDIIKKAVFKLEPFSVVVAENLAEVELFKSDCYQAQVEYDKQKPVPSKLFKLRNDTLYLFKGHKIVINSKDIHSVIGKNHRRMDVWNFTPETMFLNLKGGETFVNNYKVRKRSLNIEITAKDSALINIQNSAINFITINSDNAEVDLNCKIKILTAKLQHKSHLSLSKNPESISFSRDSLSMISISYNPD